MELISDGLLLVAALTATLYCVVLGRRLRRLSDAGTGIADQIKLLDKTIDETRAALRDTQNRLGELKGSAKLATERLTQEVKRAVETQTALAAARESVEGLLEVAGGPSDTFRAPAVAPTTGVQSGAGDRDADSCFDPLDRRVSRRLDPSKRPEAGAASDLDVAETPGFDGLLHAERVVL